MIYLFGICIKILQKNFHLILVASKQVPVNPFLLFSGWLKFVMVDFAFIVENSVALKKEYNNMLTE